jgi:predicted RNA-binding Zn-ribbon protein involved in translation (DUF1610 family)
LESPQYQKRYIEEYFYSQSPEDEEITHLEKVASERIYGRVHDVWDVHTNKDRWWIITQPTNLYNQSEFKSMDYAISFHIGVTARVLARDRGNATEEEEELLSATWRRFGQASDTLAEADEAEDFQAVGMKCRECLLAFIREVASDHMVPRSEAKPKAADFVAWSGYIANTVAPGASNDRLRSYLKSTSKVTWDYVNWLTHYANAARPDGVIAVEAVGHLVSIYGHAIIRTERGVPDRCPRCSSYRLFRDYREELNTYVTLCESCGWESAPELIDDLDEAESNAPSNQPEGRISGTLDKLRSLLSHRRRRLTRKRTLH